MRLKKGDTVEVMNKKEAPYSWCVATIMSGNSHACQVRYLSGMINEQMMESVSRKLVRPRPPWVEGVENCTTGEIVEVFDEYAWKSAVILRVLKGKKEIKSKKNQYLVRLLGCSKELTVGEPNIRMRQMWHDDKWILMGKSSPRCEDIIASNPSTSSCYQKMNSKTPQFNAMSNNQPQKHCMHETAFQESHISRSLKRMSPYGSSVIEAQNGRAQKLRAIEKDGEKQRLVAAQKVHAVAYPRQSLGEKNMHASFKIISTGYNQMERSNLNSDSDACSVGSCSVTDQNPNNFFIPVNCQETDTICSDAQSCYGSGSERSSSLPPKEEVEVSIRRLELCAYRRTLEALYLSGPLSWEQEALLTNLRIMLHISNDEHLMELKHLISAKTAINVG